MRRLQLTIESDLVNVALMAMAVNRICVYYGMDEIEAYQVELCVAEAATNAIVHAYGGRPGMQVALLLSVIDKQLDLEFSDTGLPMLAEHANAVCRGSEDPRVDPLDVQTLREGGRGLQIMREVMDEISYARDGGVNRLRLTKRLDTKKMQWPPT